MQLRLTKVMRLTKDKNGKDLINRDGRAYTRLLIQCVEYGQKFISGFAAPWNESWAEGQTVEGDVKEVKGADGKDYLNLSKPDQFSEFTKAVMNLTVRMTKLEERLAKLEAPTDAGKAPSMPEFDDIPVIGEDGLPF